MSFDESNNLMRPLPESTQAVQAWLANAGVTGARSNPAGG
jgi:hypothetical protein